MAAIMRAVGVPWALLRPAWGSARDGGRRGTRALRRRPVRVLPSLAQAEEEQKRQPPPKTVPREPAAAAAWKGKAGKRKEAEPEQLEAKLNYDRAWPGDKRLSKMVTVAKSRAFREKHGKILLEGRRLITDALEAGAEPQMLFFSALDHLKELPTAKLKRAKLVKVKFEDLKTWSDVVAPQGLIGIFSRPDHTRMTYPEVPRQYELPLSLICDNIRDPGNLGTILRSATGSGCSQVLLTKGCVDAWEPKVLRAGMGAHFRIPIISNLEWDAVPNHLPPETCVHVANSSQAAAESVPRKADSHGWVSRPHNLKKGPAETDLNSNSDCEGQLEVQHYTQFWMEIPVAVVIGGETYGVSEEAKQLAENMGGKQLLIPIVPGVDSLNSAMAASILLFEGKRQIIASRESRNHEDPTHIRGLDAC